MLPCIPLAMSEDGQLQQDAEKVGTSYEPAKDAGWLMKGNDDKLPPFAAITAAGA